MFTGQIVRGLGCVAEEDRAVGAEACLVGTAEQLVHGTVAGFAVDVPEGEVDAGHGMRPGAGTAVVIGRLLHGGHADVEGQRITTDQGIGQTVGDLV